MPTLISPTTDAVANSGTFQVGRSHPVTLSADALAGSETVTIEYSANGGATWSAAQGDAGNLALTATQSQLYIEGPGKYRVSKDATASACGVYYTY